MIDLLKIAQTEAAGGDLFGELEKLFEPTDVRPNGYPDAADVRVRVQDDFRI